MNIQLACNGHQYGVCHESVVADNASMLAQLCREILRGNNHKEESEYAMKLAAEFFKNKGEYTSLTNGAGMHLEMYRLPELPAPAMSDTKTDTQLRLTFEGIDLQLGALVGNMLKQAFYEGYQMA